MGKQGARGMKNAMVRHSDNKVKTAREMRAMGYSWDIIAKEVNAAKRTVRCWCNGVNRNV